MAFDGYFLYDVDCIFLYIINISCPFPESTQGNPMKGEKRAQSRLRLTKRRGDAIAGLMKGKCSKETSFFLLLFLYSRGIVVLLLTKGNQRKREGFTPSESVLSEER